MTSIPQDAAGGPSPGGRLSAAARTRAARSLPVTPSPGGSPDVPGGAAAGPWEVGQGCLHLPDGQPRTWTLALPSGLELLNANDRDGHWARRKRITRILRETTGWLARIEHVPPLARAHVLAVYEPPDNRRRDPANLQPSFKACVDGLVDVGVLPDDEAQFLDGPDPRLGQRHLGGRIVLHITELAPVAEISPARRAREARGEGQT